MFTKEDLRLIQGKGIDIKTIEKQLENFKKSFPFINLIAPATIKDGIKRLRKSDLKLFSDIYQKESVNYSTLKFVPASGAATRMFRDFIIFKHSLDLLSKDESPVLPDVIREFFENIEKFAFYDDLKSALLKDGYDINKCLFDKDYKIIFDYLLYDKGLNYSKLPKALLKFHNYEDGARMAFEEHLAEGVIHSIDKDNIVNIHFTVPDESYSDFLLEADTAKTKYETKYGVKYNLSFSVQKPATETIAVDLNNNPIREKDGSLVFRPGGHGALIENLNDCESDIIFIKNVDNVVPDSLKNTTYVYKKALGGMLIDLQQKLTQYLEMLESNDAEEDTLKEIEKFSEKYLNLRIDEDYKKYSNVNKINYLYFLLNRPIRICGMVRNTGEPGGGPFWIMEESGAVTMQIVEASQVDFESNTQRKIFKRSTHFNPVDIVCFVRDYKRKKFNLTEYINESTGFISIKSKDGKDIKAQELPGLWNGAMADWITLFVEVPLITFTPVKTVNDLLRPEHQTAISN